jgi:hypothetical protein
MAMKGANRPAGTPSQGLWPTLTEDFKIVSSDLRSRGGTRTVSETWSGLEAFYLTEPERAELQTLNTFLRLWRRTGYFVRGLLMKLTPARRILLAISLVFLITGIQRIEIRTAAFDLRFPLFGVLLLFTVLVLELKDKLTARDELEAGRKVQLALSPSENPAIPSWDVWLYTQPANDVGGDVIDHLQLGERAHGVALGDVAGKALPAALLSVKLQATLRALVPQFASLAELGTAMNRILYRDGLPTRFASLVYLILDADSGRVRVLNAGHMPPVLVRGDTVSPTERGGMVLGIMPEATFTEQQLDLELNDVLVVYSDGVSEAQNEEGDFFGDERLFALAKAQPGETSRAIGGRILEAVERFIGHAPQSDDISLMVLRRRPTTL